MRQNSTRFKTSRRALGRALIVALALVAASCGLADDEAPAPLQMETAPKTDDCWVAWDTIQIWRTKSADARLVAQSSCKNITSFRLRSASQVRDLHFLEGIEFVRGDVTIEENSYLENLDGLNSVRHADHLVVSSNGSLKDVRGLESLEQVGSPQDERREGFSGQLYISVNGSLESLEGLENLEYAHTIRIAGNRNLKSIEALYGISGVEELYISTNPKLPQCQVDKLVESLGDQLTDVDTGHNGRGSCD